MIRLKGTQPWFLEQTPIHYRQIGGEYVVFKPAGQTLAGLGLTPGDLPRFLYISPEYKPLALREMQQGFSGYINDNLREGKLDLVRDGLVDVVSASFDDVRSGGLVGLGAVVAGVVKEFSGQPNVLRSVALMAFKDYTTALHSVNVMAFVVAYALHCGLRPQQTYHYGLAGLLHDLGKTEVPRDILTSPLRLSEAEFREMRKHPALGLEILKANGIKDDLVEQAVIQHHEKLDGSGYPKGLRNVSYIGQLVGMVDCYEALTSEERPYRSAMPPIEALSIIKQDVKQEKFDLQLFEGFAHSLA